MYNTKVRLPFTSLREYIRSSLLTSTRTKREAKKVSRHFDAHNRAFKVLPPNLDLAPKGVAQVTCQVSPSHNRHDKAVHWQSAPCSPPPSNSWNQLLYY